MTRRSVAALSVALAAVAPVRARAEPTPPRAARAARVAAGAIRLDGRLDDAAWSAAEFTSGFTQKDPNEGAPSLDATEAAFLFDDEALYIGARMPCADPRAIRSTLSRRDDSGNSERIIVSLDTYGDRRTAYSFAVTASGVRIDYYHPFDVEFDRDYSFDPVWEAQTAIGADGWTAEMRIPFSQLRFNAAVVQAWGVNMNRWTPSRNEDAYWVLVPKSETGWASRFGALLGIEGVRPPRRLEVVPYVSSDATYSDALDPGDPFDERSRYRSRAGGDLKVGLGPSLTLEATVNPDFGQVEADPAEVNLTAFETFFAERRPFFTEGSQLLRGPGPGYFYSRRVGAAPRGETPGDYEERPSTTTILGAAKLSGSLAPRTSIAVLGALTSKEVAKTYDAASKAHSETDVAPVAGYGALRAQRQFGHSASTVGLTLAGVRRDVGRGDALAETHARAAISGGADWTLRFRDGDYLLGGFAGASRVAGDSLAIVRVQRSSAHYFQRPDARHVELDSSRTSLAGYAASLRVEKLGGAHWLWGAGVGVESPGFELNDAGQLNGADDIDAWTNLTLRETTPGRALRDWRVDLSAVEGWDYGGTQQYAGVELEGGGTLHNFVRPSASVSYYAEVQSNSFTRGGPLLTDPATWGAGFEISNNFASNTQWTVAESYSRDALGGFGNNLLASWSVRPAGRWRIALTPRHARSRSPLQYVDALPNGPPETFGTRYVFAEIDRSTLSTQCRVSYAFTPDLSLEVYAEPFAASGRYVRYKELRAAGTNAFRVYGVDDGTTLVRDADDSLTVTDGADQFTLDDVDFNVLSFRSNVVLRWEWRPGSALFVVWQQNREEEETGGGLVRPGDLLDSIAADGENVLAIKLSYWIPVR